MLDKFSITSAYSVDNGKYLFATKETALVARKIWAKDAKVYEVLAVKTAQGLLLTNPVVILREI